MILMIIFVDLLSVIPCFVVLAADLEFILYYMCVCLVDWSYLTLCNPMGCSLPGSSVHGFLQARLLEWVAIPFSTGSAPPRDQTQISCIAGGFFTVWATREALKVSQYLLTNHYKGSNGNFTRERHGKHHLYQLSKVTITQIQTNRHGPPDATHQEGHNNFCCSCQRQNPNLVMRK